jgi:hypothetical protein
MTFLRASLFSAFVLPSFVLAAGACGDDSTPPPMSDGGADSGPPPDTEAPRVESTLPASGSSAGPGVTIFFRFSEPMAGGGAVTIAASGETLAPPALAWSSDALELSVTPASPLPQPSEVTVTLGDGFTDLAGNTLAGERTLSFSVRDLDPPELVSTAPVEGATGVSIAPIEVSFVFSEPMDTARGAFVLEGGPGEIGAPVWTGEAVTIPVSGLAGETAYAIALEGFADRAGNALDGTPVVGNGALDLTTGPDEIAPVVVLSSPMEGELDVSVDGVTRVEIVFSERMNPDFGEAVLTVGGESAPLSIAFDRDDTRALLTVGDRLEPDSVHSIALTGFVDAAGNALDGAIYLGDGALDFTTGEDRFVPYVTFTTPGEGATDVDFRIGELVIVFSERMDVSSDTVSIDNGEGRVVTRTGTWGPTGTFLTVPLLPGDLMTGFSYAIDLTGFADETGTPVDAAHPYLGDGVLEFGMIERRSGELCGDALTIEEATSTTAAGHAWEIATGAFTSRDGGFVCDTNGASDDGLIYYRKTTNDTAGGGTALRVRVEKPSATSTDLDVEIFDGSCAATGAVADANRRRCLWDQNPWETYLDVGPGDYFVWFAYEGATSAFTGITVTIEEVPMPDGEACSNPFDTTSAIYGAPAMPGDPHVWTIPAAGAVSLDRAVTHTSAPLSCAAGELSGLDAVVRFDKASATSRVNVRVEPLSTTVGLDVEVSDGCGPPRMEHACAAGVGTDQGAWERTLDGPAGPRFVWLDTPRQGSTADWRDFPGAVVRVAEVEPMTGDDCAHAIPLAPGASIPITPNRPHRLDGPSCTTGALTWYRYTSTQGLGIVRVSSGRAIGAVNASTGAPIACRDDTGSVALPVFTTPGTEVCLAVSSSPGAATLTIDERPYTGVRGVSTDLGITRAPDAASAGGFVSITTVNFMAATPTTLYASVTGKIVEAPRTGGTAASFFAPGTRLPGEGGVAIGESLFSLATGSFSMATLMPMLFQVVDSTGTPATTAVDSAPSYLDALPFDAITRDGTDLVFASDTPFAGGTTHFYAVPVAGGPPVHLGSNDTLQSVSAIALDATYVYVMAKVGTIEGIYRLSRAELTNPAAVPFEVYTGGHNYSDDNGGLYVASSGGTTWIYFRTYLPSGVHLVLDPDRGSPIYLGQLWVPPEGSRADTGMAYDPVAPALFVIDTTITTFGTWFRIE